VLEIGLMTEEKLYYTKTNHIVVQKLLQKVAIIIHRVMLNLFQYLRWMMSHAW